MKQQHHMFLVAILIILAAALSRLVLYPLNFSPVIAMAIFGGSVIKDKKYAFALPLLAMFLSDLLFEVLNIAPGFWGWGQLIQYSIFALITIVSFNLKKLNVLNVALFTVTGTLLFFLLSNSIFFFVDNNIYHLYSQDVNGYFNCLTAGIPFLKNSLIADLTYSALFFGSYYLLQKYAFKKINWYKI